jgi:hypothetical protein
VLLSTRAKASRRKGHWLTMNLVAMIQIIKAQFPKWPIRVMVDANMSSMPLRVIGEKACL